MPDILTVAWMAGSLNNHVDRRAVVQLAATLVAAPLLGVEEPTERLAYALIGPTTLQEDTIIFLEQRTVGLHRIEPMFPARVVHRSIMSHLREITALLEGHPHDPLRARLARISPARARYLPRGRPGISAKAPTAPACTGSPRRRPVPRKIRSSWRAPTPSAATPPRDQPLTRMPAGSWPKRARPSRRRRKRYSCVGTGPRGRGSRRDRRLGGKELDQASRRGVPACPAAERNARGPGSSMRHAWARWGCPPIPGSATSSEFTPWRTTFSPR